MNALVLEEVEAEEQGLLLAFYVLLLDQAVFCWLYGAVLCRTYRAAGRIPCCIGVVQLIPQHGTQRLSSQSVSSLSSCQPTVSRYPLRKPE
jgi:hypothetical protein